MRDCKCCDGVSLEKGSQEYLRQQIKTEEANYVDLRNYLFSRQCKLLLKFKKTSPWEIAQRTLEFLHNLKHELAMETVKVCFVMFFFSCQNDVCMAESMIIWDSLKFEPSLQAKPAWAGRKFREIFFRKLMFNSKKQCLSCLFCPSW